MYDPLLGRFLSPDKYMANALSTQDYNRFTYARNNPLSYSDPSGWQVLANVDNNLFDTNLRWNSECESGMYSATDFYNSGGGGWSLPSVLPKWYIDQEKNNEKKPSIPSNLTPWYSALLGLLSTYSDANFSFSTKNNLSGLNFIAFDNFSQHDEGVLFTIHGVNAQLEAGEGSAFIEHAKFLAESIEKYYVLTGEAFHNELYWMQKNGTIRFTSNIGNNYLLKRSYSIVGQTVQTSKIIAEGWWRANMFYAVYDYGMAAYNTGSIPSLGKGTDLFFASIAVIPGGGWAVSSIYWMTSMGFYLTTHKTLGEHIDKWVSGE